MSQTQAKHIIIGAGLSGLTTAYKLQSKGETDFLVLESRDRIGGRILTKGHIDFGATWFHTHHQEVMKLMDELKLQKFSQYNRGKSVLVYSTMAPAHYFENDPSAPAGFRIGGGSGSFIHKLAHPFKNKIQLNQRVKAIEEDGARIFVYTDTKTYTAEKVIVTLPPSLASCISFSPALPPALTEVMSSTHTWMSNAMKIGISYATPFWRENNFSGTIIGQVGPVVELYDHTDSEHKHFALMGFINEALRDSSAEDRKKRILDYLKKYLGDEVLDYLHYEEKDWSQDRHTACEHIKSIYMSPSYGNPVFAEFQMNGKLLFSGAETSPIHGGYMDGAIFSGIKAVTDLFPDPSRN